MEDCRGRGVGDLGPHQWALNAWIRMASMMFFSNCGPQVFVKGCRWRHKQSAAGLPRAGAAAQLVRTDDAQLLAVEPNVIASD